MSEVDPKIVRPGQLVFLEAVGDEHYRNGEYVATRITPNYLYGLPIGKGGWDLSEIKSFLLNTSESVSGTKYIIRSVWDDKEAVEEVLETLDDFANGSHDEYVEEVYCWAKRSAAILRDIASKRWPEFPGLASWAQVGKTLTLDERRQASYTAFKCLCGSSGYCTRLRNILRDLLEHYDGEPHKLWRLERAWADIHALVTANIFNSVSKGPDKPEYKTNAVFKQWLGSKWEIIQFWAPEAVAEVAKVFGMVRDESGSKILLVDPRYDVDEVEAYLKDLAGRLHKC